MADVDEVVRASGLAPGQPPGPDAEGAGEGEDAATSEPRPVPIEELSVEPPAASVGPLSPRRAAPVDRLRGAIVGGRPAGVPSEPPRDDDSALEPSSSRPPAARRTPVPRDVAMRPAPALARAPIPHGGRDVDLAPAAPRSSSAPGQRTTPLPPPGAAPPTRLPAAPHLSPRMTAVFGGIFGLAMVTSIVALLIQVVPPRDDRAIMAGASASASATAAPEAARPAPKKRLRTPVPGPWRITELEKDPAVVVVSAAMDRRSFVDALADKNVPKAQAYRIMKAFEDVRKFDKSAKKDRFTVAMERSTKKVRAFEYEVSPSEIYQAREGNDGLLSGGKLDLKIADAEIAAAFYVGSDVVASTQWAGLEDGILQALDDALSGHASTESFEEGSIVRFIGIEETALGLFSRYKQMNAVEYRPADPAAKTVRVYAFKGEQSHGYFDDRGKQFGGGWQSPVPGAVVTSPFNPKRLHPVLHTVMPHTGTDYRAPTGTPIYSAYRGVIETIGPLGPCGNAITIQHANGVTTGYCHMSRFAAGLKGGDHVGTHHLIGYAGATGRATGPHLHFFAKKDGKFFNAQTLDLDGEHTLPGVDRPAFLAAKAELDKRLEAIALPEPPPEAPKPDVPPAASGSAAGPVAVAGPPAAGGAPRAAAPVATNVPLEDGGIHPGSMLEDPGDDDGEGDPLAPAPPGSAKPPQR